MVDPAASSNPSYERVPTSGGTGGPVFEEVKRAMTDWWGWASSQAAPWGELFNFDLFSIPKLKELWPRVTANATVFRYNIMIVTGVVFAGMTIVNPVFLIILGLLVYFDHKNVGREEGLLLKVVNFFVLLSLSCTAASAVSTLAFPVALRLVLFREPSRAGDVEAPETSDPAAAPTK